MRIGFACLPISLFLTGCAIVEVGVTNPIPEMTRIAVAPSFNLSQERAVDGRRFAFAYYSELQKVPGYVVIPVGVVEQAIHENNLQMNDPRDVLKLCEILNADAVVVGAITDYDPYYPPRIGMQISWYSPKSWEFYPGVPTVPEKDKIFDDSDGRFFDGIGLCKKWRKRRCRCGQPEDAEQGSEDAVDRKKKHSILGPIIIGSNRRHGEIPHKPEDKASPQSVNEKEVSSKNERADAKSAAADAQDASGSPGPVQTAQHANSPNADVLNETQPVMLIPTTESPAPSGPPMVHGNIPSVSANQPSMGMPATDGNVVPANAEMPQPIMSYTRMFDGADALVTAKLRDYVELSGNLRSGGWEAYLHRSEDFIRFTSHVMIVEMLTLHGGETRQRIVFKPRKYK